MNFNNSRYYLMMLVLVGILCNATSNINAQVVLSADGTTNTYSLINSVLAPGGNAVETPDCAHEDFGDHIDQVMDDELGTYVFRFHIHVDEDNDRCKNFDRQRNEIKTYDKSPDNLKATDGETVEYKWKFKLDEGFQTSSSFTHLHQIKAVGGSEEGMPLITLTARSNNKFQIRYAKYSSQETIHQVELSPFLGEWVEAIERITFGENGSYQIEINRIRDSVSVLRYSNDDLRMWKTDAEFLRPKWGIYRSLNELEDLRDEILFFNDFSIEEMKYSSIDTNEQLLNEINFYPNPATSHICVGNEVSSVEILNSFGQKVLQSIGVPLVDISSLDCGISIVKIKNKDGEIAFGKLMKL